VKTFVAAAVAATLLATVSAAPARAMDDNDLYALLGSEEPCSLHYDQDAIERLVAKSFKPNDTSLISGMATGVEGNKILTEQMSASTLTAHCLQVRRAAKSYGLIQ
jgi:hypothetical protein